MRRITVEASKKYDCLVGKGLIDKVGELSLDVIKGRNAVVVSDDKVYNIYGERVINSLKAAGFKINHFVFPNGEASKNTDTLIEIVNFLAENHLTRSDAVFALGGGVTGDMSALAASLYFRGISCVQIPTTLLSAVDSSVGGKTAVNLKYGKNLMGAFYQPNLVICDVDTMDTLDADVFSDGCAEVIKYGMIFDAELVKALKNPIKEQLIDVICRCIEIKRDIVLKDEFDTGLRQMLNFGHTLAHAIELKSNFSISHGRAVAIGMAIITRACVSLGYCGKACLEDLEELLKLYGLPDTCTFSNEELLDGAMSDKKRNGDFITLVLLEDVGRCILKKSSSEELYNIIKAGN